MTISTFISTLSFPLTPVFGILIMLAGLYSLIFNIAAARHQHQKRAEAFARICGWCYIIVGASIFILKRFF